MKWKWGGGLLDYVGVIYCFTIINLDSVVTIKEILMGGLFE
jgi:hypothetical protein